MFGDLFPPKNSATGRKTALKWVKFNHFLIKIEIFALYEIKMWGCFWVAGMVGECLGTVQTPLLECSATVQERRLECSATVQETRQELAGRMGDERGNAAMISPAGWEMNAGTPR